ncbi:undecaprenyl-diphosphate phosphatase [Thermococcus sp. CX2]|uniref:undecaprenyl-diphosphate phosphatase n=1 Tax=Thermococcus sp. CX2 TaxID=163006 RepID=UPI00143A00AC|nr:undecaprenyl-diphosphate phosphatase [Thermococcus sp. CX2]NJE84710.1 undecaprenyl-diphosphate phosphatase [Thermococcus sp. CX2]
MVHPYDYYSSAISGVIVALSSWLPISSDGYFLKTVLAGINPLYEAYLVPAYLGILFAVLFHFREKIAEGAQKAIKINIDADGRFLFYASIFTILVGYSVCMSLSDVLGPKTADMVNAIIGALLIGMGMLTSKRIRAPLKDVESNLRDSENEPTFLDSLIVGVSQGIAFIDGISRTGLTITSLLGTGVSVKRALELSFLIAPVYIVMRLIFLDGWEAQLPLGISFVAFLTSFVTSILTMSLLLKLANILGRKVFVTIFGSIAVIVYILGVVL